MRAGNEGVQGTKTETSNATRSAGTVVRRSRPEDADIALELVCRALAPGKQLTVGRGLMLVADRDGHRRWIFRFSSPITGKRRDMGLGPFPEVALAAARTSADAHRAVVRELKDPIDERNAAVTAARAAKVSDDLADRRKAATLLKVAREFHKTIASGFRNRKHRAQWLASIEGSLPQTMLQKPVAEIGVDELLDVMLDLRARVPETGRRVRQRLEQVFADAALRGLCDRNPAALIAPRLRKVGGRVKTESHRSLPYRRLPDFLAALRGFERADLVTKLALELVTLSAGRSGEIRGARWSEFDIEAGIWIVPGDRMKGGEEHRVPLTRRMLEILKAAETLGLRKPESLVFPSRDPRKPLSDMALTQLLRRLPTGVDREDSEPEVFADLTVVHGLRATFSTWANECTSFHHDVIEAALAHRERDRVRAAYNRASYWDERIKLAKAWEGFATGTTKGKVLPMRRKRA